MSPLPLAILAGFALAIAAPWIAKIGRQQTGVILSLLPLALFLYFFSFIGPVSNGENVSVAYSWQPEFGLNFSFYLDGLGLLFALLITGVGVLVLIYSSGYLGKHIHQGRFYASLLMFMASMLGLVLADNIILLFVFWELTSISSYLLIGFEHGQKSAREAAWQALLVTGIGGLSMLAGLVLMGLASGTFELSELLRGETLRAHEFYLPVLLLILGGAFTKSAQFPFHFWLPNAMEAPTPVSAYLHSATMVKAGIYLLARLSPMLGGTPMWEALVTSFGAVTMVVGAFMALLSTDFKRMLAYLTVSALGIMTMLLGIGSPAAVKACIVFLFAHALYKGALFMVAGAVYHETGTRDLEKLGGLRNAMPLTTAAAVMGAISLAAFGPMLSFIGKEMLLEALLNLKGVWFALLPATIIAATIFVTCALFAGFRPFFGKVNSEAQHEAPISLRIGPLILASLGILFGVLPQFVERAILSPGINAVLGKVSETKLALWHGFNLPFLLSLLSVAAGTLLYFSWGAIRHRITKLKWISAWGPERCYEVAVDGLKWIAAFQTRILQSGYLPVYVVSIVAIAASLVGYPLIGKDAVHRSLSLADLRFWEAGVAVVILLAVGMAVHSSSRLAVIASLSIVGYGVALAFILFGAPDVAMTQFLVETLMLVLLIVAFFRLPRFALLSSKLARVRDIAVALAFGSLMSALVFSAISTTHSEDTAQYFSTKSVPEAKAHNLVNAILVDFRALDTLGEITVLATAAIGVFALLKLRPGKENK